MTRNSAPDPACPPGEGTVTIPVHEEQLRVETFEVETGRGVRVQKRVSERPQQVTRELWHDEVEVLRVPVDRVVAEAPATRYEGDTLVVPVLEEVLVVEKRYRIKEELRITRSRHKEKHAATVPVRTEDVTVERFDDNPPQTTQQ
ncbi:YsnF/AvaK domain-containing protein [Pseudoduganella namucuonensis]|uniref:Conserved domain-containing protein n=1 Tax=Pseudoduganella namucuonensis TaxID=1035707 RepID=A0A1I7FTR7_9BURK|nr:DUF2382 domain-containing protein [Pseudoduganella namucuonensis]SFU39547.1 conserved domain-containing protein [Pseudoduganella namucuonensis]